MLDNNPEHPAPRATTKPTKQQKIFEHIAATYGTEHDFTAQSVSESSVGEFGDANRISAALHALVERGAIVKVGQNHQQHVYRAKRVTYPKVPTAPRKHKAKPVESAVPAPPPVSPFAVFLAQQVRPTSDAMSAWANDGLAWLIRGEALFKGVLQHATTDELLAELQRRLAAPKAD